MQLQEFDEDVVITLQAKNPQAPQNIVRFDYTVGEFIPIKLGETMIDHLEIEVGPVALFKEQSRSFLSKNAFPSQSTCLHVESPEGKKQIQRDGGERKGNLQCRTFCQFLDT